VALQKVAFKASSQTELDEKWLQQLLFDHPDLLPASLIHPSYSPLIPVCQELNTDAGRLDLLYVTPHGGLVIVETKLWRNPEARREVIGQILNYAAELSRWTYADLQRMLAPRLPSGPNPLYQRVARNHPEIKEGEFCDNVTRSLNLGQFLLMVVGDGIKEGARQIADFLVDKSSLAFHLGMVEMAIYALPEGGRLVIPRVQVRTEVIRRHVLLPQAAAQGDDIGGDSQDVLSPRDEEALEKRRAAAQMLWSDVLRDLRFDDPTQPTSKPTRGGNLSFSGPADTDTAIKAWFAINNNDCAGVYLKLPTTDHWRSLYDALEAERQALEQEIGQELIFSESRGGLYVSAERRFQNVLGADRPQVVAYLRDSLNRFVSAFRHRVKRWHDQQGE
jgi:hypothetical protein